MKLTKVDIDSSEHLMTLYRLLAERTTDQAISHKEMPMYYVHVKFVRSEPYKAWYVLQDAKGDYLGATYLSKLNEIGIFIFKEHNGKGYGPEAVRRLMLMHTGPFLANINPANKASIGMFEKEGFKLLQVTYVHE